jgi:hypothetical protein
MCWTALPARSHARGGVRPLQVHVPRLALGECRLVRSSATCDEFTPRGTTKRTSSFSHTTARTGPG